VQKLGAIPIAPDRVEFRVWAPNADSVAVRLDHAAHELERADDGIWSRGVSARELFALRAELPRELRVDAGGNRVTLQRGAARLSLDFDGKTAELVR
jgi:hypothetical protein